MTNTELQSALSTMQHRLNELDTLTEILADVCGAAEQVRLMTNEAFDPKSPAGESLAWLKRKLGAAYRAGIKPTDYGPKAVDLTDEGGK